MANNISRKGFIKTSALAGAGFATMPFAGLSHIKQKASRNVTIGFIGTGGRGTSHVAGIAAREDVSISALCDVKPDNAKRAQKIVTDAGMEAPELYTRGEHDWERMLQRDDLDGVIIATPWLWHLPMAKMAMKTGKYVGVEVPAATTVQGCWDLVETSEKTGMPCMLLENVCYRRDVMAILNMVRKGRFGEMIHARCGYEHNLLNVLLDENGDFGPGTHGESEWRTAHHIQRNADFYPTHGIGPVSHWLDINRGNRFLKLSSTSTKARGLHKTIVDRSGVNGKNADINFEHGDVVTSTVTTANGQSVILTNNTTLPKPYSLGFRCQGTNGLWQVDGNQIYLDDESPQHDRWEPFDSYQDKYDSKLWKDHAKEAEGSGHGGMDWFVRNAFVESVKRKTAPPIDVYDAVTWSVISPLSAESLAQGGDSVEFPDFTDGKWMTNDRIFHTDSKY